MSKKSHFKNILKGKTVAGRLKIELRNLLILSKSKKKQNRKKKSILISEAQNLCKYT